jgi:hypothetical protein
MLFVEGTLPKTSVTELVRKFGVSVAEATRTVERMKYTKVYLNAVYQVNVTRGTTPFGHDLGPVVWLSIKRRDKEPIHDWRELQEIKNALVGPENEGFEVYPAESRLVDTANQYHLWVFADPKARLPVGFTTRELATSAEAEAVGAKQREFIDPGVYTPPKTFDEWFDQHGRELARKECNHVGVQYLMQVAYAAGAAFKQESP